jgi:hypothetical protein
LIKFKYLPQKALISDNNKQINIAKDLSENMKKMMITLTVITKEASTMLKSSEKLLWGKQTLNVI